MPGRRTVIAPQYCFKVVEQADGAEEFEEGSPPVGKALAQLKAKDYAAG